LFKRVAAFSGGDFAAPARKSLKSRAVSSKMFWIRLPGAASSARRVRAFVCDMTRRWKLG
jgi:hypothetical protein